MEAMITKEKKAILLINKGVTPLIFPKGTMVARMLLPKRVLDQETTENRSIALIVDALVKGLSNIKKEVPEGHPDELVNGPKLAEGPEDPVPKEELLQALDFNDQLNSVQRKALEEVAQRNYLAFGLDGRLGKHPTKVKIELKPGVEPISLAPYGLSPLKKEVVDKQLKTWLELEVIQPSHSPWGFPVVIVFRNGKARVCIDYRKLNDRTVADEYPIPRQTDIIKQLQGSNWLSTFDALAGFNQLEIAEEDRKKTAFRTHWGLYEFLRMPFGIQNGPANFQRVMNEVLAEYLWLFALVYIDDIITYSVTFEEHLQHVDKVLKAIIKAGLTLAPAKCHLGYQSLLLLGQKVSRLGVSTHKEKVDAIVAIKPPTTVNELQKFNGMMVYFSSYIPWYSEIMLPLTKLTRKDVKWDWTPECQEAFDQAKLVLQSSPILAYPIPGAGYRLYTDASQYAIAGILQQIQPIKVKDLQGTRLYKRLKELHEKGEPIPPLVSKMPEGFEDPRPERLWHSRIR